MGLLGGLDKASWSPGELTPNSLAKDGPELAAFLSLHHECWDYKHEPRQCNRAGPYGKASPWNQG